MCWDVDLRGCAGCIKPAYLLSSSPQSKEPQMKRSEHLRDLLNAFDPADDTEAGYLQEMHALLQSEGDPFSRDHFVPGHLTASAFLLSPSHEQLLLIFHGKLHRWLQPGGHVDPDDHNIISAARRELQEEVGITDLTLALEGIFDIDVHEIPAIKQDPPHKHFDVRFLFHSHTQTYAAGSDAKDAKWWNISDISAQESDRSVMRAIDKIIARQKQ